jgi:4-amino-4-deoxychorismate lyase
MSLLFESIRLDCGILQNPEYHNQRLNFSRHQLFGLTLKIDLKDVIVVPEKFQKDIVKCKVYYTKDIEDITFEFYQPKRISSLKLVENDEIDYSFKYTNRHELEKLLFQKGNCDEVLIIKKGMITDTSFSNIAFFDGKTWLTPSTPLLKGTQRNHLLQRKIIVESIIKLSDLHCFEKAILLNAMLPFENHIEIPVRNIV